MRPSTTLRHAAVALVALLALAAAQAQPRYTLTDLSAYASAPGVIIYGVAINEAGQITGSVFDDDGNSSAFLYTPGSGMVDIGPQTRAGALNNAGQVTGEMRSGANMTPFLYSTATGLVDLGGLNPGTFQSAGGRSINDAGQVLGYSFSTSSSSYRTFLYDAVNGMRDLGTTPVTNYGGDINNAGVIAGTSIDNRHNRHAVIYDSDGLHDLGTLGGSSFANAINDAGTVVGYSGRPGYFLPPHAFIYSRATGMSDLHLLGGLSPDSFSVASAINERGQVVGHFAPTDESLESQSSAFLFDDSFGLVDLNTLVDPASASGWHLSHASGINNAGQIIGYGLLDGNPRGFLLSTQPIPEPSTWMMMLVGLAGTVCFKRWGRSQRP